ncbi:V-set and immunoglobulin domain-containing protein 1-like [Poecilia formosa]|uniref:V-set and immunoglobulin domain-containing protein 1-like n=1 Tax=Poecilia formosa TaxID=48698 RepID=A0A087XLS7_POEFO|nr:PREDICTED: V-set and immunoglobulin domain-containing protein 1-like [Poecilia formosa]
MTPSGSIFCLLVVLLWRKVELNYLGKSSVHQQRSFMSAEVGSSVTLHCSYGTEAARYYWYKQSLGQKLQIISISYKFDKSGEFHDEFQDNPRFTVKTNDGKSQLNIFHLKPSDTGTYFCASGISFVFEFGEGVTVSVKNPVLENTSWIRQSESGTVQMGSSVTLNCTVQTGSCGGEHSVYWFRHSGESHPGLIYTHGGSSDQCGKSPNTQTHTCMYDLPIRNLNKSHAGTYYCAVISCGQVLFGNGTKLDVEGEAVSLSLVYFLSAAFIFTVILSVLLAFTLHKMHKRNSCQTSEFNGRLSCHPATSTEVHQVAGDLHYAAVNVNQLSRPRRHRKSTETECVYSAITHTLN